MTALLAEPAAVPALDVDPASVRAFARCLLAASTRIDALGTFVTGDARVPGWRAEAATAYLAAIGPLGGRAEAMSLALRRVGARADQHADTMATLLDRRQDLLERRDHLARSIADRGVGAIAMLRAELGRFDADVTAWVCAVAAEEAAMVRELDRVRELDHVERVYGGAEDPADLVLASMPDPRATPHAVHVWWTGLTAAEQQAVVTGSPDCIGNRDGIPAAARHAANLVALTRDLAAWRARDARGELTPDERRWLRNAEAARRALDLVSDEVDPATGAPIEAQLYLYDPEAFHGDGRVAIAAGDVDTADNVTVLVPGMTTEGRSAPLLAGDAVHLYQASRDDAPGQTDATLFWAGYDAPSGLDSPRVVLEAAAEEGGNRLADTIDGLRALRPDDPAHLTVVGHSYGSTTLADALAEHHEDVDDAIVVGSPGLGDHVHDARDLRVPDGHVWVGANSRDPVAHLADDGWLGGHVLHGAGLGDDPAEDTFHAHRFEAESATRDQRSPFDEVRLGLPDHNGYFAPDTESLHNLSRIVNGDYAEVDLAAPVHDPWWGPPRDPEAHRTPTAPDTGPRVAEPRG